MLLLYIDVKPMRLQLTKMPWLTGGCHICFHFSPSGCCRNKFQSRHGPGTCSRYLCWAQFQHSFKCAREGPALMHYAETSVIIWFRGALRGAASLGFGHGTWRGRRSALQSCGLCMWASSWSLKPPQSEIRPNSVSLTALIQARQSRTPDSTLRLCYRAIRVQRARSLANFTGAIFREWESYTRWNWPGACIAIVLH